jgi:hypothetical protein
MQCHARSMQQLADGMLKRNAAGEWVLETIRDTQGLSIALADFVIHRMTRQSISCDIRSLN